VDGQILFMASETGDITTIEPEHCTFLTVLGEIGLVLCQKSFET